MCMYVSIAIHINKIFQVVKIYPASYTCHLLTNGLKKVKVLMGSPSEMKYALPA